MRITVDIDTKNPIILLNSILRGIFLLKKLPYIEKSSRKGYHLIWFNINTSLENSYKLRLLIGDDPNRVRLDRISKNRIQQVLFNEKQVIYFNQ